MVETWTRANLTLLSWIGQPVLDSADDGGEVVIGNARAGLKWW